jgi:non-ribosomal peptide synthetase component E (peptide arylation enzyme)
MKIKAFTTLFALLSLAVVPAFAVAEGGDKVLDAYTAVSQALAADDLAAARKAAGELATTAKGDHPEMAERAAAVAASDSLETAREKFKPLSADAEKLAEGKEGYFVMTCPMVKADWVQKDKQVANPYYGASMLRCGGLKKP